MSRVVEISRSRTDHPQLGTETLRHFRVGALNVTVTYGRGRYGYPDSPNFGVRLWWAR
jgi:hypothetical protein